MRTRRRRCPESEVSEGQLFFARFLSFLESRDRSIPIILSDEDTAKAILPPEGSVEKHSAVDSRLRFQARLDREMSRGRIQPNRNRATTTSPNSTNGGLCGWRASRKDRRALGKKEKREEPRTK